MPGPSNIRRKRKSRAKDPNRQSGNLPQSLQNHLAHSLASYESTTPAYRDSSPRTTPSPTVVDSSSPSLHELPNQKDVLLLEDQASRAVQVEQAMFEQPFIHDPGNGPRVRGARAFMSSFFAQPPAFDDPLCAEFAQDEVLQMLCTILPEETALTLWYNKSRARSRICPACQRLYRLGDILPDHVEDQSAKPQPPLPQLLQEQEISGLCSPVCFIMASFNFPGAIKSAWGRMADEMDDQTWELLNGPGESIAQGDVGRTLGMLVKMTRLHDLGLAQLCFDSQEVQLLQDAEDSTS
ncbi:hypothetical protein B0H34DRAFT_719961 [Crassisporium funariophilum]|nr:hypothetical protein B0H34DRAFT_719961 [Crassisporium funariophilum]